MNMNNEYLKTKTTVSMINFVFCPRYRRKIFLNNAVEERFRDLVGKICIKHGIKILALECDKDHAHIFLQALPTQSPSGIMAKIKGASSRVLRKEFEHLGHQVSLWTRSFFVSTAGRVSSKTIKEYIGMQKKKG